MESSTAVPLQLPCDAASARLSVATPKGVRLIGFGGYDKNAYVYAFGEAACRATLSGHTTAVSSLAFDNSLSRLVGGSDGGTIRMWDLNNESCIRTFGNAHKATINSIDYHLFGEFVATCSRDTNLRVWDIRKKSCLQVYKNAGCELGVVRFCPSGRWIATGGVDGVIRLYDLTKGEPMATLEAHTGAIESLAFHDEQYFLAAGSKDGTVSLWDLDRFQKVFQSVPLRGVSAVLTTQKSVFAASANTLKVYNFDALGNRSAKTIETPWVSLADVAYDAVNDAVVGVEWTRATSTMFNVPCGLVSAASPAKPGRPSQQHSAAAAGLSRLAELRRRVDSSPAGGRARPAEQPRSAPVRNAIPMLPDATAPARADGAAVESHRGPQGAQSASELVEKLSRSSAAMTSVLQRRLTHVKVLRSQWPKNSVAALKTLALIAADHENDAGVVVDFLNCMQQQRMKETITIDSLVHLLECIRNVMAHPRANSALLIAMKSARSANNKFRSRIDEVLRGQQFLANGVDISMEARVEKARATQAVFDDIYRLCSQYVARADDVGEEARHLQVELPRPPKQKK